MTLVHPIKFFDYGLFTNGLNHWGGWSYLRFEPSFVQAQHVKSKIKLNIDRLSHHLKHSNDEFILHAVFVCLSVESTPNLWASLGPT